MNEEVIFSHCQRRKKNGEYNPQYYALGSVNTTGNCPIRGKRNDAWNANFRGELFTENNGPSWCSKTFQKHWTFYIYKVIGLFGAISHPMAV